MIDKLIKLKSLKCPEVYFEHTHFHAYFHTMAINLTATGPLFFTINGFNFEKWNDPNNDFAVLYLQEHRVGLISGGRIYFDIHKLNLLGDMTLWHDTLNYAISDDININTHYEDQRDHLQHVLHEMRIATAHAIMVGIDQAILDADNIALTDHDIDQAYADDELTDYEDWDDNLPIVLH